jgi:hypothetical protein
VRSNGGDRLRPAGTDLIWLLPSALVRNAASQAIASLPEVGLAPGELFSVEESLLTPIDVTKAQITIRPDGPGLSAIVDSDGTVLQSMDGKQPQSRSAARNRGFELLFRNGRSGRAVQFRKCAAAFEQLIERTRLNNLAFAEDEDAVGSGKRGQPVRHNDHGPANHDVRKSGLDRLLVDVIERACGLIRE